MDETACLTQDPALVKIQSFVSSFEDAVGQGQALDVDPSAFADIARTLPGSALPSTELKGAGHRLWEVCATAAAETPPLLSGEGEAAARELACELIQTAMARGGTWQAADCFDLILQWAVTGKVWLDLAEHTAAVRCLSRSSATWDTYSQDAQDADVERLGEVALQTQLWMSTAMTHLGNHDQAFVVLSKAAGMLKKSPSPAAVSQGLLLRTCMEQAAALRESGSARLAADTLMLACTVLPAEGSHRAGRKDRACPEEPGASRRTASRAWTTAAEWSCSSALQSASCRRSTSVAFVPRSLQALLLALCAPGGAPVPVASGHGGVDDMGEAALGFVAHKRAKLADCLDLCRDLADRGLDATFLACLARLRARLKGGDPGQLGATWVLGAQVLASRIEEAGPGAVTEAGETAVDALSELLDEVEAATGRPPELAAQLSELLWGLSTALCQQGRPLAATTWLHRALPFLSEEGHVAAAWRVLAACHFKAGEVDHARRCADTALAHDPADAHAATLVLIHAVSRGEAKVAQGLIARARAQELRLSGPQGAYLLQEIMKQPPSTLHLQCLELLLDTSPTDPDAAQEAQGSSVAPQRLLRKLLEVSDACSQPESRLAQYLDRAIAMADADPTWFGEFAWSRGVALAKQGRWSSSVTMFGRAHVLLGRWGGGAAAAQVQCVVAIVRSLLQAARCEEGEHEAQQLRQQAVDWAQQAQGAGGAAAALTLAQLHFEALCFLRSPALEGAEGKQLRELAAPAPRDAARLARVAVEAGNMQQAVQCLRAYMGLSGANVAAARRQLVNLCLSPHDHSLIEEAAQVCQDALSALSGAGSFPSGLPEEEVLWLAAAVWNAGVELLSERREVALRLTGLGLSLLFAAGKLADDGGRIGSLHERFGASLCALGVGA